jgi:hypothetical protein
MGRRELEMLRGDEKGAVPRENGRRLKVLLGAIGQPEPQLRTGCREPQSNVQGDLGQSRAINSPRTERRKGQGIDVRYPG